MESECKCSRRSECGQIGMMTSSAKSKKGEVLTSCGTSPRGGGKLPIIRATVG